MTMTMMVGLRTSVYLVRARTRDLDTIYTIYSYDVHSVPDTQDIRISILVYLPTQKVSVYTLCTRYEVRD